MRGGLHAALDAGHTIQSAPTSTAEGAESIIEDRRMANRWQKITFIERDTLEK